MLKILPTALAAIALLASSGLYAAKTAAQNGMLQISPAKSVFDVNPGGKEQATITVRNNSPTAGKFNAVFSNFTAGDDESGEPKIIEDDSFKHGIKTWLSGPVSITVNSNQAKDYTLAISVPAGTKPGTYYGLVRFDDTASSGTTASIGSLIFVNVGAITQKVAIEEFNTDGIKVSPTGMAEGEFVVRLRNTGNGYTVPKVVIEILDDSKSDVQTFNANEGMGGILPETIRKYTADFSRQLESNKSIIARLTVTSESGESVSAEKTIAGNPPAAAAGTSNSPPAAKSKTPLIAGLAAGSLLLALAGVLLAKRQHKKSTLSSGAFPGQPLAGSPAQPQSNTDSPSPALQSPVPPDSSSETPQPDK